ncbi:DNA-formamidopyrimidine glycosylase family protein [Curtobacterium sp. B18]|uniref:DNA-formamidopyrimidine glycosylase family protein n=1 Tax=Curtobacterium sp. B18 TaxID=95614 RepID=UPI00034CC7B5|nr:DNA-formamidopyrimidine glycosylase family protein [Curtobacterium sp. B18]
MPEGDSVFRLAARLRQVDGALIRSGELRGGPTAGRALGGRTVVGHATHGKHLLTRFDDRTTLHTHMRTTGSWTLTAPGRRLPAHAVAEARVRMAFEDGRTLWGIALPVVEHVATADEARVLGPLGPDLLHEDFDRDAAVARFAVRPGRTIRAALLDQRTVAGLGNLWVGELCFLRGIHPDTPVERVDLPAMLDLARRMLVHSATVPSAYQVTTGRPGRGTRHWVVGRAGRPCLWCRTPVLARDDVERPGSPPRRVWWCPRCQPIGGSATLGR